MNNLVCWEWLIVVSIIGTTSEKPSDTDNHDDHDFNYTWSITIRILIPDDWLMIDALADVSLCSASNDTNNDTLYNKDNDIVYYHHEVSMHTKHLSVIQKCLRMLYAIEMTLFVT